MQVFKIWNPTLKAGGLQSRRQRAVIIGVYVSLDFRVADFGNISTAIFKQVVPMVGHTNITEGISNLQAAVIHLVFATGNMILVTDITRIELSFSLGITLRRYRGLIVKGSLGRMQLGKQFRVHIRAPQ